MVFIPEGFAQANYLFRLGGVEQTAEITHGVDAASLLEDWEAMAQALMDTWDTSWGLTLSNAWSLVGVTLRVNVGGPDLLVAASTGPAQTGGDSAAPPPPQVAVLIKKQTGFAGRHNRGRFYFPPIVGEGQVDSQGQIQATVLAARQVIADDWLSDVNALSGITEMCLLHSNPARTPTPISSLVVDQLVATQRRRIR